MAPTPPPTAAPSGSIYFNGTPQRITYSANQAFALGAGDFTVEAWVHPTARATLSDYSQIFGCHSWGARNEWHLGLTKSGLVYFMLGNDGASRIYTASALGLNVWTHVAAVRRSGVITIYLNGEIESSASLAATTTNAAISAVFVTSNLMRCGGGGGSFTQPPPTCPMTGTPAQVVAQAKAYCFSEPNCRGTMYCEPWDAKCVQYCSGASLSSNSDWTAYTKSTPEYVFYQDYSSASPYVAGYCTTHLTLDNYQENLCATSFAVGSSVRGAFTAQNPSTCTRFDSGGTSELGMTVAEVQAICSAEPNCAGYGEWTNGRFRLSSAMVRTNPKSGDIKCVRKVEAQPLGIGASQNGEAASSFTGYLTNIRIIKGEAVYTTGFNRPLSELEAVPNTSLLLKVRGSQTVIVDSSSNAFVLTNYGATYADFSPFT